LHFLTLNSDLYLARDFTLERQIRKGDNSISKMVSFGYQHFEHQLNLLV
jgi:hypothetical protein